jgi:hypothetical protein
MAAALWEIRKEGLFTLWIEAAQSMAEKLAVFRKLLTWRLSYEAPPLRRAIGSHEEQEPFTARGGPHVRQSDQG